MYKTIKEMLIKYKEIIMYGIIGVITTIFNYILYAILTDGISLQTSEEGQIIQILPGIHFSVLIGNIIAWVITVIFAYITNKLFVFESKSFKKEVLKKEIVTFTSARVFTLFIEEAMLGIFVNWLKFNSLLIKLIANIVVIIVNYILSKLVIFKDSTSKECDD